MSAMQIERVSYGAFPKAWRIANGEAELIVTESAGPRVLRYGFIGGQNFFREWPDGKGFSVRSEYGEWFIMGGHRLWAAPELMPSTYHPDNDPVSIQPLDDGVVATPPDEKATGLRKSMTVTLAPNGTSARVAHRITNLGAWPVEIGIWVLSVMAQNGLGVTGFPPRGGHPAVLAPTNPLIMWAFTDFTDHRLKLTHKYLTLRQDPAKAAPQKLGTFTTDTWAAYLLNGEAFLKRTCGDASRRYADLGANFEIFTNADFLELETLGPLTQLMPGASVEHVETWSLHRGVAINEVSDAALDAALGPVLNA